MGRKCFLFFVSLLLSHRKHTSRAILQQKLKQDNGQCSSRMLQSCALALLKHVPSQSAVNNAGFLPSW